MLEYFSAISTFISSVIIAATGIFLTFRYNSNQLQISRNKELADLIPRLGSPNVNERKFGAISLALYGKKAIHALIATLDDENENVRMAAVKSLGIIGEAAIPELTKTYQDRRNNRNQRGTALYALGQVRAPNAYDFAASALDDSKEDPIVRQEAATAMALLKDKRSVEKLLSVLKKSKEKDVDLTSEILWALGEIGDVANTDDIIKLLNDRSEDVRIQAVWTLGKIGNENVLSILSQVTSNNDETEKVRNAAKEASDWLKRRD